MRPIWSGAISFGLVTIPIKVVPATESHDISFRQIHTADGGRIRYRKVCEIDGQELRQDEIVRGYETATGTLIPVTDADLDGLPLPTAKAIEIVAFVPAASIDPIQIGTSYYLAAAEAIAAKPYELLRQALERSSKVAVAKFAMRDRERLGLLRVKDNVIMMHALRWPDEIRASSYVPAPEAEVSDEEVEAAVRLTDSLSGVDIDSLHDGYRDALEQVIAAKTGTSIPPAPTEEAPPASAAVVDLMAILEQSVQDAKTNRGQPGTVHELPARKTTAKKTAATKSKPAAKKPATTRKPRSA
ncbi:Ku protein [Streptomyces sp. NPDC051555]|uniref:non-homologous end joining protein Ku n=1 Tax=Streptomyces sp. NPDC051555 TaxID=3365657 RepID=UPI0037A5DCC1